MRVAGYAAPLWPDGPVPKQAHLDLAVDDLDDTERRAVALGGERVPWQPEPDGHRMSSTRPATPSACRSRPTSRASVGDVDRPVVLRRLAGGRVPGRVGAQEALLDVGGHQRPGLGEDLGAAVGPTPAGVGALVGQQVPVGGAHRPVEGEGVGEDARGDRAVGQGLADALVGAHRRPDEEPVAGEGQQGLADHRVVGRADGPGPHVERGRADRRRVGDVDAAHHAQVPPASRRTRRAVASGPAAAGAASAWRTRSGSSTLVSTSARATVRSPWVTVTVELPTARPLLSTSTEISRSVSTFPPAGEHGVHRPHVLAAGAAGGGHHDLAEQLAAVDHLPVRGQVAGPVAPGGLLGRGRGRRGPRRWASRRRGPSSWSVGLVTARLRRS